MMRRTFASVAVAVLLFTAGCIGGLGGGASSQTTPDGPSPPGIANGAVQNVSLLVERHHRILDDASSLTVSWRRSSGDDVQRTTFEYSDDGGIYWTSRMANGRSATGWAPKIGEIAYQDVKLANGTQRYEAVPSPTSFDRISHAATLRPLIDAFKFEVAGTDRVDGTRVRVIESTKVTDRKRLLGLWRLQSMQSASLTLKVDRRGIIRSYHHTVRTRRGNITASATFSKINATTVDKPDWVVDARRQLRKLTFNPIENDTVLALDFVRGYPIRNGTTMYYRPPDTESMTTFTLDRTLRPGNVYYLTMDDGEPTFTTEKPAGRPLAFGNHFLAAEGKNKPTAFTVTAKVTTLPEERAANSTGSSSP